MPTKSVQYATPDSGYDGLSTVTVAPIPNVYITTYDATAAAEDIRAGKTAYVNGTKLTGTYVPDEGLDTSDATAQAGDILAGKTAYVDGEKITGTLVVDSGGGVSGGITPFTVEYGTELPSTVVENQIFIITTQTPTVFRMFNDYGIEISISYTGEDVDDTIGTVGSIGFNVSYNLDEGIMLDLGIGATLRTGIAPYSVSDSNACYLYSSEDGSITMLTSYIGNGGSWVKLTQG